MKGSKARILEHLRTHDGLTSYGAFKKFGETRLSARIKELRDMGYAIETVMMEGENRYGDITRYAFYVLKGEPNNGK